MSKKNIAIHCFNAATYIMYVPIEKKIRSEKAGLTEYFFKSLITAKLLKNAGIRK